MSRHTQMKLGYGETEKTYDVTVPSRSVRRLIG